MNDRIVLQRPNPKLLVLRHSILPARLGLAFYFCFTVLWYFAILSSRTIRAQLGESWVTWIVVVAPFFSIPQLVALWRTSMEGRVYEFDAMTRTVRCNGNEVARFGEVQRVQLRTFHDPDAPNEYRLSLVLDSGTKISLAHAQNLERMAHAADDIADLLNVEVARK